MKSLIIAILSILALLLLYLAFWPVPVSPLAWDAPQFQGLVGPYAPNDRLSLASPVSIGEFDGPEDIAGGSEVIANGGKVEVLNFEDGCSTSKIIAAIRNK